VYVGRPFSAATERVRPGTAATDRKRPGTASALKLTQLLGAGGSTGLDLGVSENPYHVPTLRELALKGLPEFETLERTWLTTRPSTALSKHLQSRNSVPNELGATLTTRSRPITAKNRPMTA
jgi:hypothetical protein